MRYAKIDANHHECLDKIENEAAPYAAPVWAFELVMILKNILE